MLCTEATPGQAAWARRSGLPHFIYALVDPFTDRVRYIGRSTNPWGRLSGHCKKPMTAEMREWIRRLYSDHAVRPKLVILEQCPTYWQAEKAESRHIHEHLLFHGGLFNRQDLVESRQKWTIESRVRNRLKAIRKAARREVFPVKERPAVAVRKNAAYFLDGKRVDMAAEARRLGISRQAVHQRLQRYEPEIALSVGRMPSGIAIVPRERFPVVRKAYIPKPRKAAKPYKVKHGVRYTHEERRVRRARMAEMVFSGFTIEHVALEFDVTTVTVKTACRECGVSA